MPDKPQPQKPPSILEVIFSVLAAAFGVQSSKNGERDLSTGNVYVFIVVGVIFTILFVMSIIGVVSMILDS